VFHKVRLFEVQDKLVFDSYQTWHGPYGPVSVSPLRDAILQRLPTGDYIVDNDMQMVEHSVEAMVPWLQAYNREVEIVSILVPYMDWETMERLAGDLSRALGDVIKAENWRLGEDIALICSADAVHYGDSGWRGSDFAPFGTDVPGYQMAVNRDIGLAEDHLCGPINGDKLRGFLHRCVDVEDVKQYEITWCGRFSVPFGLNVASRLTESLEGRMLDGTLLDYGSSVSEASWVGYAAIGYR
jgi:AmmeMemoRadiSam system protein B